MGMQCAICGKKPVKGWQYTHRGKAKYLGGVGRKVTGSSKRTFKPNLQRIQIDQNGTVQGSVPDAACLLAGSSADYVTPANATIDIDISGCRDVRFNGRYSGKLLNNPALKYASIRLSSMHSLESGTAQISAIIRH